MKRERAFWRERSAAEVIGIFCLLFVACAVIGWVYEVLFYRIDQGMFVKRGQGLGPWLPIYGFGSLLIWLAAHRLWGHPLLVFLVSGLTAGAVELVTGWALYRFCGGLRLWDHNVEIWNWGNLGGYVCARSVLVFALGGCAVVYAAVPALCALEERIPRRWFYALAYGSFSLFALDAALSYGRFFLSPG